MKRVPSAPPDCSTDSNTLQKVATAASKLRAVIDKACGGSDKMCGGDLTKEAGGAALGWPATCPNFENGTCTNVIGSDDCTGIADCLACIGEAAVKQAIQLYFGALEPADPKTHKALNKCQQSIGREAAAFLATKSKVLAKCWEARLKGLHANDCTPPAAGDGKTLPAIMRAASKRDTEICRACGGKDKKCGGGDDFAPGDIGFIDPCTAVTLPSGGGTCGAPVGDLGALSTCVGCVTEFKVDCVDRAAVPEFVPVPPECNQ